MAASGLPPGLVLSSDGSLTGALSDAGSWQFDVTAEVSTGAENGMSRADATFTLSAAAPELSLSGSRLVAAGAQMELGLRVGAGGLAVPGIHVQIGGQGAITDLNGQASVSLNAPQTVGLFEVQAGFAGAYQAYEFYAYTPSGVQATTPAPSPGPPPTPRMLPMEDNETIVQSRWISVSRGTLEAHLSGGRIVGYVNGQWRTFIEEADGNYTRHETQWRSSNGQQGEGEPPSLQELEWQDGLAEGVDQKFPDTEEGRLDLGGEDIPQNAYWSSPWPEWTSGEGVHREFGGWWGRSKDRSHHVTAEVRGKTGSGCK
jgi:hypothetical protein